MQGSIILLAIVCMIQTVRIYFIEKDAQYFKRQIIVLYTVIHKKFNLTVEEAMKITEDYAEQNMNFIDNKGA